MSWLHDLIHEQDKIKKSLLHFGNFYWFLGDLEYLSVNFQKLDTLVWIQTETLV